MRRYDRQVTDKNKIIEIINSCTYCRLGLCDEGKAYIVPMNFGLTEQDDKLVFYFHSAKQGRKIDLMQKNNEISFEMDTHYKLTSGETACDYTARFQSIIGEGKVYFIEDNEDKKIALDAIMYQSTKKRDFEYSDYWLNQVCIFKLEVSDLTCKEHE